MENNARSNDPQPPPAGFPTVGAEQGGAAGGKKKGTTTKRGEPSFIEGCIAVLCCCWLCELCCD
ncbi:hypothetical protein BDA96_09G126100 [Sorghum bicolor]|uniref:Cysteine-rich transmembrane domain-containing protein n=1 Tax=Sorghum bicolor TaxID=4558 RepID=A0A921Q9C1_SORBI|nr:hypothetical protein BDA96_09G126100 [Sorghum bicolor]